jgi:UDP-N-acetylglucosamine 1-carboxyvinyltransferase
MMAAVLAKGTTRIINAAMDPEVTALADMLNQMGARISNTPSPVIDIEGVDVLHPIKSDVMGDRLIAGTLLFATAGTTGEVTLDGVNPDYLPTEIAKLEEMGHSIERCNDKRMKITVNQQTQPVDILTYPFPGFATDLQPSVMAALLTADGTSRIRETVFPDRFSHVPEYCRLGANVSFTLDTATIVGVDKLDGANIMASDIRAGAGLTVAGLIANGESTIQRVYHVDRGYPQLETMLTSLGADIYRENIGY